MTINSSRLFEAASEVARTETALRSRIAELEEEVRQLRVQIGLDDGPCWRWRRLGLTGIRAKIFEVLMRRHIAPQAVLLLCVREETAPKCLHVHISRLRAHLRSFGIEIETIYAGGYSIPPSSKQIALALAEEHDAAEASIVPAAGDVQLLEAVR